MGYLLLQRHLQHRMRYPLRQQLQHLQRRKRPRPAIAQHQQVQPRAGAYGKIEKGDKDKPGSHVRTASSTEPSVFTSRSKAPRRPVLIADLTGGVLQFASYTPPVTRTQVGYKARWATPSRR